MSTIINQNMRSISELEKCTSYSEMSDVEVEALINYKIKQALASQEVIAKNEALKQQTNEIIKQTTMACEQSLKALQYRCEQVFVPTPLTINKVEFRPMEFGNE